MNTPVTPATSARQPPVIAAASRFKTGYVLLIVFVLLLCLAARAVAGYFLLGNEAVAIRRAVAAQTGGQYQKKFAVRLGWITTALVRYGTRFVNLPPEPRAALDTLRRVEVGVYKLTQGDR